MNSFIQRGYESANGGNKKLYRAKPFLMESVTTIRDECSGVEWR